MNFKKLNLSKFHCSNFELEFSVILDEGSYSEFMEVCVLPDLVDNNSVNYYKNYSMTKAAYSFMFILICPDFAIKKRKDKKKIMINSFNYRKGHGKLLDSKLSDIDFKKLYDFYESNKISIKGRSTSSFSFPLDKYKPIIDLPFSRNELISEKKIKISGVDLDVESQKNNYSQRLLVQKDTVYTTVRITDISSVFSKKIYESILNESYDYAQELVIKR